jgi:cell division protein ZapA
MSDPARQPVRVTIMNQSYSLLVSSDAREVQEVAQSVDDLLHSIAEKAPTSDSSRIAVLGCMHLADRLRALERDLTALKERVDHKSVEFAELLEQVIEGEEG